MATITISSGNSLAPIQRMTSEQRVANFRAAENSIYNKFSPYDGSTGGVGFNQPFVYTKLTDSKTARNLTKYDNQTFPVGSTVRDLERVGKFIASGTGVLYTGKQLLLQNQNAFNETRIYNPLSVLKATAKPGSTGAISYPQRHLETGGGLLNFFRDALLNTVGIETKDARRPIIEGTATGPDGQTPFSNYATSLGGARAGLIRYNTATSANARFSAIWAVAPTASTSGGGFLSILGSALKSSLNKLIPSTNPMGILGSRAANTWKYRPEYPSTSAGAYYAFLNPLNGLLNPPSVPFGLFYNDRKGGTTGVTPVTQFHKYYPSPTSVKDVTTLYAPTEKLTPSPVIVGTKTDKDGTVNSSGTYYNNLESLHKRMEELFLPESNEISQKKASAERYTVVKDNNPSQTTYKNYSSIPSSRNNNAKFYNAMINFGATVADRPTSGASSMGGALSKLFAGASGSGVIDKYNAITPDEASGMKSSRTNIPSAIIGSDAQSTDVVFFYFYDLVNETYVPFRATISGLSEQNSADWEDVTYMGRADKLFVYKGFSRDANLSFSVYANSIQELIPMWKRIDYLVGFTRPSKYTGSGNRSAMEQSVLETSVRETVSQFIYPPMVTLRLGDLYNDQPCIITSVGVNIPDDTNWESYRGDEDYSYIVGPNKKITTKAKSRQLPLKADISITMKLMEKSQSQTTAQDRWGFNLPL